MTTDAPNSGQTTLPPFSLDLLPEPYRADPAFKDFKDWDGFLKSYKHASSMTGVDKNHVFKIPQDGNMSEVYKFLGVPEKPTDYAIPKDLKAGEFSQNFKDTFLNAAHKSNLTKDQFESMVRFVDASRVAEAQSITERATLERQNAEQALKSALGDAYDQNINLAKDAIETHANKAIWDKLDKAGLTTDKDVVNFLAEIGKLSKGEDDIVNGSRSNNFALTPTQARAEINAVMADPAQRKAYLTREDPAHELVMEKLRRLYASAYGQA